MTRKLIASLALASAMVIGGCEKQLTIDNPNSGETKRVLGTPNDAEALVSTYWKRWMTGVFGSITTLEAMANIYGLMNYSSLSNECQNSHAPFTGATNFNQVGNGCANQQARLYTFMGEVNRVAATFVRQTDEGLTLGSDARNARGRAWAYFLMGLSTGYTALWYDSAAVVTPAMTTEEAGELIGAKALADSSYAFFQKAIDETNKTATGEQGFPIPNAWMPSPTQWNKVEFVKLIRSYRARIRANMARTPAERGAADWAAIVADVQNGITSDHLITTSTTVGPILSWRAQYMTFQTWHQMPPWIIGMADVSGSYAAWIASPLGDRGAGNQGFFMVTPDLRFPQGATRAAQQADFAISSCNTASTVCKRYFVNRASGGDQFAGLGWGFSNYDFVRFYSWHVAGDGTARNGNTTIMTFAEMDLIQAEGLYRQGNFAGAAAIVNKTRVKNGLPAITAFDASTVVPGGATNCVPKVPVAPFNVVACGNLWEALKYEKRIETAYTTYSPWFLDNRGWGDLAADTPLYWATPVGDLQARGVPAELVYGTGIGAGNAPNSVAVKGTYGW